MGIMLPERNAFDFVMRPESKDLNYQKSGDSDGKTKKDGESGKQKLTKTLMQLKKQNIKSTSSKNMATVKMTYWLIMIMTLYNSLIYIMAFYFDKIYIINKILIKNSAILWLVHLKMITSLKCHLKTIIISRHQYLRKPMIHLGWVKVQEDK